MNYEELAVSWGYEVIYNDHHGYYWQNSSRAGDEIGLYFGTEEGAWQSACEYNKLAEK